MRYVKQVFRWIADFVEVYLPVAVFVILLLAFLTNVLFRYVIKDPQNWTFELSVNAFVVVGLLGACAAYRREDHVVFDLLYTRMKPRGQSILRMLSYLIVIAVFLAALPATVRYLWKLPAVTSILKIPDRIIFASFPILMVSTVIRSAYRLVQDIKAFRNRTYVQTYNTQKDALI
jgi:TRAP-type C4-dicarboxylate transport system permease small subunit